MSDVSDDQLEFDFMSRVKPFPVFETKPSEFCVDMARDLFVSAQDAQIQALAGVYLGPSGAIGAFASYEAQCRPFEVIGALESLKMNLLAGLEADPNEV